MHNSNIIASSNVINVDKLKRNKILEKALHIRAFEKVLLDLYEEGLIHGTVHICIGQELISAVFAEFITEDDHIFSNHRCHGHFLAYANDYYTLLAEILGHSDGCNQGLGGSQHLKFKNFLSSGIQAGLMPIAAGISLNTKIRKNDCNNILFIGDGTLGQGVAYETFNIASKWELPLLVIVENNFYAQSTAQNNYLSGSISSRFSAFDIPCYQTSTWDLEDLIGKIEDSIRYIKKTCKSYALIIETYRLAAHSKGDDLRDKEEIDDYIERDILNQLLKNDPAFSNYYDSQYAEIKKRANELLEIPSENIPNDCKDTIKSCHITYSISNLKQPEIWFNKLINQALCKIFEENNDVFMLGEDICDPYGGAFKVTKGLSNKFPDRIINTPISEAAITGIAIGMALKNNIVFLEIMFGDFLTLCFDQINNQLSKIITSNNKKFGKLIIRTAMGGRRGYGSTHSQTLDKQFLGIPNLQVVALNYFSDVNRLYRTLIENECGATLLIENKDLYSLRPYSYTKDYELLKSNETLPTYIFKPAGREPQILIVCYGGTSVICSNVVKKLYSEHDLSVACFVPTKIYPFKLSEQLKPLAFSAILFVEEGPLYCGISAEFIAQLAESYTDLQKTKVMRIGPSETIIPAAKRLEKKHFWDEDTIVTAALNLAKE